MCSRVLISLLKIFAYLRTNLQLLRIQRKGNFCWRLGNDAVHMTRRNSELILRITGGKNFDPVKTSVKVKPNLQSS